MLRLCILLLTAVLLRFTNAQEQQLQLQSCSQSSLYAAPDVVVQPLCGYAIDGNTNQQFYTGHSCSHTNNEAAWWQAQTLYPAMIERVLIYNRQDCCADRLMHFNISVDDVVCVTVNLNASFSVMNFTCGLTGQVIKVTQLQPNFLHICELQAFGQYVVDYSQQLPLSYCTQSSLILGGVCSRGIDNNTSQIWSDASCTHTDNELSWWQAATAGAAVIKLVKIYNRLDCCSERLDNFAITVDGVECASYSSSSAFSVQVFFCNKTGQVIRINNRMMSMLTLCEVQVFGDLVTVDDSIHGQRLALGICSQSSLYLDGVCSRAIDNNTSQMWQSSSCTHTQYEQGWWQALTTGPALIRYVKIYNRLDCCSERLNNFAITVDGVECASYSSSSAFSVQAFLCNRTGEVVRINNRMQSMLTLCEVQVFGELLPVQETNYGQRLALSSCTQSSLYLDGVCSRAIDNNPSQVWSSGSCTHTQFEQGWWQASTASPAYIRVVKIYNRLDCCSERLNNFAITVDGVECATYSSSNAFSVQDFPCDVTGQVVRINNRMQSMLTLCEVQVFGDPISGPSLGPKLPLSSCTQSSVYLGGVCSRAIDNNLSQLWLDASCTHTQSELGWWQAETTGPALIKYVKIYNRIDCCSERLNNFSISVNGQECATYSSSVGYFSVKVFDCNRIGQVIRIDSRLQTYLSLCEVEVFGEYVRFYGTPLSFTTCSQSSVYQGGVCKRAIDGSTNQVYSGGSCTRTKSVKNSWWEAKVHFRSFIAYVRIYNRQDCCADHLNHFVITVDGIQCAEYHSVSSFSVKVFECRKIGTKVRITSRLNSALTLCEVEAFGTALQGLQQYKHGVPIGCFVDKCDSRDLPILASSGSMTLQKCSSLCAQTQSAYFGLQRGTECWCGPSYGRYGRCAVTSCNTPCSGDARQKCGGPLFNLVYLVTV